MPLERIENIESLIDEIVDSSETIENYNGEIEFIKIPVEHYRSLIEWREE